MEGSGKGREPAAAPQGEAITVRAIRRQSPDGTRSVLLTHLIDETRFPAQTMIALYFRREAVETPCRAEKTSRAIETFHSETENGLPRELFAEGVHGSEGAAADERCTTTPA